jgi:hypothetical protein
VIVNNVTPFNADRSWPCMNLSMSKQLIKLFDLQARRELRSKVGMVHRNREPVDLAKWNEQNKMLPRCSGWNS